MGHQHWELGLRINVRQPTHKIRHALRDDESIPTLGRGCGRELVVLCGAGPFLCESRIDFRTAMRIQLSTG
jgi:hypothetical protein